MKLRLHNRVVAGELAGGRSTATNTARWTKGNNPLHCLAHSLNPRFYSKEWLDEGIGRVPPHKDREISRMRMTCFKKFFRIPQELAQVKEEYAKFSSCSDEFSDYDSITG
ncbi:hypothetical protein PR202_ga23023 [Eleusine coracana subsp. coracana]|uniref:Uncharacterized protein n=1 Tax=Eleusine coracana subsp. coracana TaxID=191504 RepID=A0AAV5D477_ELECO|nr:hypothetical protein PR202_ga23023 [Eleusine coracana subsp. coracana]